MKQRRTTALLAAVLLGTALPVLAQDGLRLPSRIGGWGLDPSLAQGWFSQEDRLRFAPNNWRDAIGFSPAARLRWAYPLGHHSLGMSMASGRDYEAAPIFGAEMRQYGLFGRYSLSQDWSLDAEYLSRDQGTLIRVQDLRIGLRRQF
ncbi:MAG TPA: hypothetical protein VG873_18070 [Burkholderiales bacterium]|nr:hypothetical protein [Burkholderiales bacterium]